MIKQNFYKVLGVPKDAADREIRRAYYKLAKQLHPDKATSAEEQSENEQKLAIISEAYNVLKDKERRKEYDKSIKNSKSKLDNDPPPTPFQNNTATSTTKKSASAVPEQTTSDETSKKSKFSPKSPEEFADQAAHKVGIAKRAYQKGVVMMKQKDYKRAIDFFEAAIKNDDTRAEYHSQMAHASLLAKKGFSKAIESCEKAVQLDPYNVDHKLIMARIYETVGSISNAERVYMDVLRWDPQNQMAAARLNDLSNESANEKSFFKGILKKIRKQ